MRLAGIYVRQSKDVTGEGLGVARQEALCRDHAAKLGWQISGIYCDNDTSAYTGKVRPQYQRLRSDIQSGMIDAVVVYDLDRLHRRPIELEEFIELADQHRTALASVGGDVDLSTDNGRLFARIKGAVARAEVERKSERQKAAARQRAMNGKLHLPGRKSFGYQTDGRTPDPVEKAAIVDAAQSILDGVSLRQVARRWNDAGLTTATGKQWCAELVSQFIRNPRLAGIRTYQREPVIVDGKPVRGDWEPILDDDTFEALRALLSDPRRRWPRSSSQLLLSGIAVCDRCEGRINSGGTRQGNSKVGHRYRCVNVSSHINRTGDPVDRFVTDVLVRRLAQPDAAAALIAAPEQVDLDQIRDEAARIHQRLDGLSEAYADGAIDLGQLRAGTERLRAQLGQVEARGVSAQRSPATVRLATAADVKATWEALDRDVQRTVIGELMTIRLLGPGAGIRYVSAEHVKIEWR